MPNKMLLLSIKPEHASKIFAGSKTVELRRTRPKLNDGDLVVVYVSSPVKAIKGAFEVGRILSGTPAGLWKRVKDRSGLTWREFCDYFTDAEVGYALEIKKAWTYKVPINLQCIRKLWDDFNPPQSYRYLSDVERDELLLFQCKN